MAIPFDVVFAGMRPAWQAGGPASAAPERPSVRRFALIPDAYAFYDNRRDWSKAIYEYCRMRAKQPVSVFGRRLREARERMRMPQDRLGVRIGLDEGSASARISRYESGIHEPPFGTAERLAKVLGVPTAFLYCADDELAGVLLGWARLSKPEKKRVRTFVDSLVEPLETAGR